MNEIKEKIRSVLSNRQHAYQEVFKSDSLSVQAVLKDLIRFCRANESTFHEDPRIHAVLEGRREVFLRIQKHLNLSTEDLWKLYKIGGND